MRSAIKYWLEEAEYSVQLSESSDFEKDSTINSYDACLKAIGESDYFILLIGSRVGGMYDKDISITRQEYRRAIELVTEGKMKRIIAFVRSEVSESSTTALERREQTIDRPFYRIPYSAYRVAHGVLGVD
jgi:hypothetical protein